MNEDPFTITRAALINRLRLEGFEVRARDGITAVTCPDCDHLYFNLDVWVSVQPVRTGCSGDSGAQDGDRRYSHIAMRGALDGLRRARRMHVCVQLPLRTDL